MGSLSRTDKLLLGGLLPLWLICLGFHVKEISRTGFAEPPIYAATSADSTGYPAVGGFRMERGSGAAALELGDLLIRVGDSDLRGVGYLGFDAIALDEAGESLEAPLVFERAGKRQTIRLEMLSSGLTFYRVVPVLAWVIVATLRVRESPFTAEAVVEGGSGVELSDFDRAALETLGLTLALPIRKTLDLVGFLCLGPKRSGDIYTSTDMALLTAVSDRVSSTLSHFDQAEMLESARLMQESLRRYVPGAIAEQIESGEDLEAGEREVTVLFVDLRSYTRYAEGREAKEIFSTINRFTDIVSGVVRAHGGCVVEFNGDGIMTVFGAPRAIANKELAAITAGREIFAAVRDMSDGAEGSDPQLSVGVGIATGQAYVGNVKAVDHLIWTAIGNTTNLAAQLESLTRDLDAEMVVDAATWAAASQGAGDWLHVGNTVIRGRSKPIDIYAVPLASSPTRR